MSRMRSVQYYFFSFMEVDNHTITIGPLPYIWKFINKIHISIFWHQKIGVISIFEQ